MKCELDVYQKIVKDAVALVSTHSIKPISNSAVFISHSSYPKHQAYKVAIAVVDKVNKRYKGIVAHRYEKPDGQEILFAPEKKVVSAYFDEYKRGLDIDDRREAERIQAEDAARAGKTFDDAYLFDEASQVSQLQMALDNLDLTKEVLAHLYNNSSKQLSLEDFSGQAIRLASKLRTVLTPKEIVEKIKCL